MSTLDAAALDACPWSALDAPGDWTLDDSPVSLITRVAAVLQNEVSRPYARAHGLTTAEWRLIVRLAADGAMRVSQLCRASGFDKAQASRVLRVLEERRLVTLRVSEVHKRHVIADLTAEGRDLAERLFPEAQRSQRALLALLTDDERSAMYSGLRKWLSVVHAEIERTPRDGEAA